MKKLELTFFGRITLAIPISTLLISAFYAFGLIKIIDWKTHLIFLSFTYWTIEFFGILIGLSTRFFQFAKDYKKDKKKNKLKKEFSRINWEILKIKSKNNAALQTVEDKLKSESLTDKEKEQIFSGYLENIDKSDSELRLLESKRKIIEEKRTVEDNVSDSLSQTIRFYGSRGNGRTYNPEFFRQHLRHASILHDASESVISEHQLSHQIIALTHDAIEDSLANYRLIVNSEMDLETITRRMETIMNSRTEK